MRKMLGALLSLAVLTLAAGCGDDSDERGLEKVKFLAGASILGREAYSYVALDKGYLRDAGFDVEVQAGKGTGPNLQLLQSGQADFATVDITAALIEYGNGRMRDFTIVSAGGQRNMQCVMALSDSGIKTPKDLAGKKIGYLPGGVGRALFPAYAKLAGFDASTIQWVNIPIEQHPQNLAAGTIDAALQFAVGKPGVDRVADGRQTVVLPYTDYLTDLYGVGLSVTKEMARDNPDRVRRFNEAMLQGLRDTIENPAEAGKIYAKYQKVQPEPVAAAENKLMVPYVKSASSGTAIGGMDTQRVARNISILKDAGVIPAVFQPQEVVSADLLPQN